MKKRKFADGGNTKIYSVPGRGSYGASEELLRKRASANPKKPSDTFDPVRRGIASVGDTVAGAMGMPEKRRTMRSDEEAFIQNRDAAYNKAMKDKAQSEEALKSMKETNLDSVKEAEYKKGGKVKSASSRADGIAQRGKTRGKMY